MTEPVVVVVMGVSGSGKTTLAHALADRLHWRFQEGDDLHPAANLAKMSRGEPLTDADREPWLRALVAWIEERLAAGESGVLTCSALHRSYRDVLRAGRPQVRFCHVTVDPEVLRARLERRTGHYMPPSLLPSQLAALEPLQPDEPGVTVPGDGPAETVVEEALRRLGLAGDAG
ncbi:MAG: gluconokinase [Nocardioides sp.]